MNIEQLKQQAVINEWQLGQQLNTAVHTGARDKFNLLLSFLSDDARDFAQFDVKANPEAATKNEDLRAYFELPASQPLLNAGPSTKLLAELNEDLHQAKLADIRLKQLLSNEAVLSRNKQSTLPLDIIDNLPLHKKLRVNTGEEFKTNEPGLENQHLPGIDASLLDEYKHLDLDNNPLKITRPRY
ncbi:VC2046/SO_2500 family protein [Psychromonas arctica]|uniref:VC2046/SO_2500 family protein n=1 Tax=Psychromonas arctica TaxID=168275 RepID=UPI002FCF4830